VRLGPANPGNPRSHIEDESPFTAKDIRSNHTIFRVFRALIFGVCLARLAWPELDRYLVIFDALWHPVVFILGSGLLGAGFLAVILIHFYMGADWRSGTRAEDRTRLITTGPFTVSRNPMMLGVIAAQVGLFLALPSLFTLVCLVLGVWAVTAQVGVEERLLRRRFGEDYDTYLSHTPRWLIYRQSLTRDNGCNRPERSNLRNRY
jgi:protein-S-isoprenylcysteine O-methyltransferase Ste14